MDADQKYSQNFLPQNIRLISEDQSPSVKETQPANNFFAQFNPQSSFQTTYSNNLFNTVNPYYFLCQNPYFAYQYNTMAYMNYFMNSPFNYDLNRLKMNIYLNRLQLYLNESHKENEDLDSSKRGSLDFGQSKKLKNSLMSTATQMSNVQFLTKVRERQIKNNKFVYLHSSKCNPKKSSKEIKDSNSKEIREEDLTFSKKSRGSKYRGVSRNGNQWQVKIFINKVLIMVNKRKRYVGSFCDEEEAARIYDKVSLQNHGFKAKTNFFYSEEEIRNIIKSPSVLMKFEE